jgi:hypothetical protein
MKVTIIESVPESEVTDEMLRYISPLPTGFPAERRVWGRDIDGRWRLIPLSWLGTHNAIERGFQDYLSPALVADYLDRCARFGWLAPKAP